MRKFSRVIAVVLAVVLCLATFGGCKKDEGPKTDELVKDFTVNVYSWWDPTHPGITALKKGFEEKYKDYNVKLNFVMIADYYTTMLTKLAANKLSGGKGEQIDVMMLATDQLGNFASNNVIQPLDKYASKEYLDDLYPAVLKGLHYDNHLYALARDITTKCMILNLDIFEKYGIKVPEEGWTLEDFKAICLKLAEQKDDVWGYSFDNNCDPLYIWSYLFGGDYFDPQTNTSLISGDGSVKGIQFLYDLIQKDGVMSLSETTEYGKFTDAFNKDKAAMISGGLSQVDKVEKAKKNFKVIPLPLSTNGEQQSHVFINAWTIPECSTNVAWAWKVIEYFSGSEGQKLACDAGMGLPASQTADIKSWIAAKGFRQEFVDALGYKGTVP
ncbi:MAG: sugar ABC transporter substrate-binding protein, partial [Clostridia bacterium]